MDAPRYRCDGFGNLTRFDVTVSERNKSFYHYTVGGDELVVEDTEVLSRHVDGVVCRWCGHGERGRDRRGRAHRTRHTLEGAMTEPPAEILSRLRPIPTYTDHPTTRPARRGRRRPRGRPLPRRGDRRRRPVVLLFLSAACLGCRDLWEGLAGLHAGLAGAARLAVVTRGPRSRTPQQSRRSPATRWTRSASRW